MNQFERVNATLQLQILLWKLGLHGISITHVIRCLISHLLVRVAQLLLNESLSALGKWRKR
jgi:hypothetical protein